MRRPWTAGLLIGAMAMALGCYGPRAVVRTAVAVPPNLKGLSVYLEAPDSELVLTDSDCNPAAVRTELLTPLRKELLAAGYQLVATKEKATLLLTLGASTSDCWRGTGVFNHNFSSLARLSAQLGDATVYEATQSFTLLELDSGQYAYNWPADFTNALTKALTEKGIAPGIAAANLASASPDAGSSSASSPNAPSSNASAAPMPKLLPGQARPNAYALVVGVEKYRDAPAAPGARTDATRFVELAKTTLGVPSDHVLLALDERATRGDVDKHLDWLTKNVTAGGRIYLYFAGHGAAEAANGSAYLMPHDADPKAIASTGVALSSVLARLSATKAESVVAFVDSCFSGEGGRSVLPPGARPLMKVIAPSATQSPRVALLSSAGANEISGPTVDGAQGLFTSLLVEGVGTGAADFDGDGNLSVGEIAGWVGPRVTREAKKANRDQTPVLTVGNAVGAADELVVVTAIAK
jgi:hypothetical protein